MRAGKNNSGAPPSTPPPQPPRRTGLFSLNTPSVRADSDDLLSASEIKELPPTAAALDDPATTQTPEAIQSIQSQLMRFTSKEQWKGVLDSLRALRSSDGVEYKKNIELLALSIDTPDANVTDLFGIFTHCILPLIEVSPPMAQPSAAVRSAFGDTVSKSSIMARLTGMTSVDEWGKAISALKELPVIDGKDEIAKVMIKLIHPTRPLSMNLTNSRTLLQFVNLPVFGRTIDDHVRKRCEVKSGFMVALFGSSWAMHVKRMMVGNVSDQEIARAVKAEQVVTDTEAVYTLSSRLKEKAAVVLTGESGSGKTVASMLGSTLDEKHFAVYLGSAERFTFKSSDLKSDADKERVDAEKARIDAALSGFLEEWIAKSTGHSLADAGFEHSEGSVLCIILDELGSRRDVLRSYLRLASQPSGEAFVERIKRSFGVDSVRFVAVGTGCDDAICPAGSRPDTYSTVFTTSRDGRAIWRSLVKGRTACELWPYVCAVAGGLEVDGVVSRDVLGKVESHPEGFVSAGTGRALVGNARMAALLASRMSQLVLLRLPSRSVSALIEASLPCVAGLHHQSVHTFVGMNGLANYGGGDRMELVAKALALTLGCTDADIPKEMFYQLCTKAGVLTSCGVEVGDSARPERGRVIEKSAHVAHTVAIEDRGRRYRVTEAMAVMYLTNFGVARRPARTGEAFEHCVLDYVELAMVPASIVSGWSRDPSLRQLSDPSPSVGKRCGLFELLVEALTAARVSVGQVLTFQLPRKFEPEAYRSPPENGNEADRTLPQINTLSDVWTFLEGEPAAPEGVTVAVVLNADRASGADLMVLCPGHFAIHIQNKSHQQTRAPTAGLMSEFKKMGAPSFGGGAAASACIASSAKLFPTQYFAIVRCVGPGDTTNGYMQQSLKDGGHTACRYIEVQAGTDAFYPLTLVSNVETKPALSSIGVFSCPTATKSL